MRKLLLAVFSAAMASLTLLGGDLTITSTVTGRGAMAKDGTQIQYISPTRMRVNHEGTRLDSMVDYDKGVIYTIDHGKRTITRMTFQDLQDAMQALEEQTGGMAGMMTKMMFGDASNVKVEKLGADTVLGRPCQKVRITVGKMIEELSLDPSLTFPIHDYAKAMSFANRMPGPAGVFFKKLYEEIGRLKGVPLRTRVKGFMGMDMTTEATAVSTAPIPAGTWALPADYKVVDGGKQMKESTQGRH
ncbi:MAG TPA: DUF4412 domain-containing protein [Holophagaceae bacterium]